MGKTSNKSCDYRRLIWRVATVLHRYLSLYVILLVDGWFMEWDLKSLLYLFSWGTYLNVRNIFRGLFERGPKDRDIISYTCLCFFKCIIHILNARWVDGSCQIQTLQILSFHALRVSLSGVVLIADQNVGTRDCYVGTCLDLCTYGCICVIYIYSANETWWNWWQLCRNMEIWSI